MNSGRATGLRRWTRDPGLPARGGDGALVPPGDRDLVALAGAHLNRPGGPPPEAADWVYSRWKPGVSLTCVFELVWDDGNRRLVTWKRYTGDKAGALARRSWPAPGAGDPLLRPGAVLPDGATVMYPHTSDRVLELRHLLEPRRLASFVAAAGLVEPRSVRRRRTAYALLRYKPEHRAVYRVDLSLRAGAAGQGREGCLTLAARVLPPKRAAEVIARRERFERDGGGALALPLAAHHARHGLLLEPWLDALEVPAPDDFGHAEAAGELLARLHGLGLEPSDQGRPGPVAGGSSSELFERFTDLPRGPEPSPEPPAPERLAWVHGDLHPDQVARMDGQDGPSQRRLLDLDEVHLGDRDRDLASWIADALHQGAAEDPEVVAAPLLEGYAAGGGASVDRRRLLELVAGALVERAAGSIRRLEAGALERAARTLALASDLGRDSRAV